MKVLLTGATGFIGAPTALELRRRGHQVVAVGRRPAEGCETLQADLLAPGEARRAAREAGAQALLHLAWLATPGLYWTSPENLRWVAASLELVQGFAEAGGERAVVAGTCAEYDWAFPVALESGTPTSPTTLYGTAKDALRRVLEAWAPSAGVSFAWGRVFSLYGPREPAGRLAPSVVTALLAGREALCGDGSLIRDYLHVADVARAFVDVLESPLEGPVNIASGQDVSLGDLVMGLADRIGRPDLVRLGARPSPPGEPRRLVADTGRLVGAGFRPKFGLQAGLDDTVAWWRTHLTPVG